MYLEDIDNLIINVLVDCGSAISLSGEELDSNQDEWPDDCYVRYAFPLQGDYTNLKGLFVYIPKKVVFENEENEYTENNSLIEDYPVYMSFENGELVLMDTLKDVSDFVDECCQAYVNEISEHAKIIQEFSYFKSRIDNL